MKVLFDRLSAMTSSISEISSAEQFEEWLLCAAPGDIAIYHRGLISHERLADPLLKALVDRVRECSTERGRPILAAEQGLILPHTPLGLGLGHAVQKRLQEDLYEYWFIKRNASRPT